MRWIPFLAFAISTAISTSCCASRKDPGPQPPARPSVEDSTPVSPGTAGAAPSLPAGFKSRLAEAKVQVFKAIEGNSEAESLAGDTLEKLHEEAPNDPQVLAFLGTVRLLQGKSDLVPWSKLSLCNEGLDFLDKAVELAPEDVEVRFMRGMSTRPLPFFFGRGAKAAEDIAWVASRAVAAAKDGKLDPTLAAAALYHDGLHLKGKSDLDAARERWKAAASLAPDSEPGKAAREELKGP